MRTPSIKERLAAGETLFGTFLTLGSPLAAEALGLAGFDWLMVDLEHGGGDESLLLVQLLATRAGDAHALVRVESDAHARTARALDLGAEGAMCPQVNSAEQARAWAAGLHHSPIGTRGIALATRGARFGTDPQAHERTLGIAQIESPRAVAEAEAIAEVDGIDVLFVGPTDLSHALGCFRDLEHPTYRTAVDRVVQAATNAGKTAGIYCASAGHVPQARDDGFRMIAVASDGALMAKAAREALGEREHVSFGQR